MKTEQVTDTEAVVEEAGVVEPAAAPAADWESASGATASVVKKKLESMVRVEPCPSIPVHPSTAFFNALCDASDLSLTLRQAWQYASENGRHLLDRCPW